MNCGSMKNKEKELKTCEQLQSYDVIIKDHRDRVICMNESLNGHIQALQEKWEGETRWEDCVLCKEQLTRINQDQRSQQEGGHSEHLLQTT